MQALVFDFDGTLVDTETPELIVWQEIFAEHSVQIPDGYWGNMIGRGAEQEFERPAQLLERLCGISFEGSIRRHERVMKMIDQAPLRPGVKELLEEAKVKGIPVAVASSSKHQWVDILLEKRGAQGYFTTVVCADDVARAKPFPDLYLEACRHLGSVPADTIAFEDSPNGISAAVEAGLFTITTPNSVTASLDLSKAHLRIDDLTGTTLASLDEALVQRKVRHG